MTNTITRSVNSFIVTRKQQRTPRVAAEQPGWRVPIPRLGKLWLGALLCALLTGCASTGVKIENIAIVMHGIARDGTMLALEEKPEWRPKFETVAASLSALALVDSPTPQRLHAVLLELPIKELKTARARLIVGQAETLYQLFMVNREPVRISEDIRAVSAALASGIREGLGTP